MKGLRLRVTGRVQGVFFRNWTVEVAQALGVTGWVRNRRDGSVEIEAYGDPGALDALRARVNDGPRAAEVAQVRAEAIEGEAPSGFARGPTV